MKDLKDINDLSVFETFLPVFPSNEALQKQMYHHESPQQAHHESKEFVLPPDPNEVNVTKSEETQKKKTRKKKEP